MAFPAPVNNDQGPRPRSAVTHQHFMDPSPASKLLVVLLIVLSLLVIGSMAAKVFAGTTSSQTVKSKQFQAIFLVNGQVYFGHLSGINSDYLKLTNIYYLQVQQQVQPGDKNSTQQPQVSLAKLGSELHGPEDVMYISHDQVTFWDNLKDDGKVAQAIKDFQSKK